MCANISKYLFNNCFIVIVYSNFKYKKQSRHCIFHKSSSVRLEVVYWLPVRFNIFVDSTIGMACYKLHLQLTSFTMPKIHTMHIMFLEHLVIIVNKQLR